MCHRRVGRKVGGTEETLPGSVGYESFSASLRDARVRQFPEYR
jgi:hypothetical protein